MMTTDFVLKLELQLLFVLFVLKVGTKQSKSDMLDTLIEFR